MIKVKKIDEAFVYLDCDDGTLKEISDRFSYFAANYKHMPKFKNKIWDGKIRLVDTRFNKMPSGLVEDLVEFCDMNGYEIEIEPGILVDRKITKEAAMKFISALNIDPKFKPCEYQIEAFRHALSRLRSGFLSPTSSGKSFIIYLITQFILKNQKEVLIIVPTTNLVNQMHGDFADYNRGNPLDTHLLMQGTDKKIKKPVTISTWQSAKMMPKDWLERFDCVIVDEVHGAEAKELTAILQKMKNCRYRFGFTGTMRDTVSNKMSLESHFGRFSVVTTLEELEKDGFISKLNIKATVLKYPEEARKKFHKSRRVKDDQNKQVKGARAYALEMDFIDSYQKRNEFLIKYAQHLKGNVLILFKRVDKHGSVLYEMMKEQIKDADVHYVYGGVDADQREKIRKLVDSSKKKVIVLGSIGTMSTGANMKQIRHIMFVSTTKSNVTVMQSIGRGFRLDGNENLITLHDFTDDLRTKTFTNASLKHFQLRLEMYDKERFNYNIETFNLQ